MNKQTIGTIIKIASLVATGVFAAMGEKSKMDDKKTIEVLTKEVNDLKNKVYRKR